MVFVCVFHTDNPTKDTPLALPTNKIFYKNKKGISGHVSTLMHCTIQ